MSSIRILTTVLCLAGLAALSCSNDPTSVNTNSGNADVFFSLDVDGAPLQLNSMIYTTPAGTKYSIKEFRFIISDLTLYTDTGKAVLLKNVWYFDIGDASTQIIHAHSLPHANYNKMTFTFGLTTAKNVRNEYPSVPALMVWPTGLGPDLGYHYMQLEGNYETDAVTHATAGYTTHTGPRQLDGTNPDYPGVTDAVAYDFSFPVSASFTPAHIHEGGLGELDITFNLNDWYLDHLPADGLDTQYDFTALSNQMIMGNLDAQGKLQTNGPGCFGASLVAHGGHDH
jgi:hypothetical protein